MTTAIILAGGLGTRLREHRRPTCPSRWRPCPAGPSSRTSWTTGSGRASPASCSRSATAPSRSATTSATATAACRSSTWSRPAPLGTGGALALAATRLGSGERALLLNGDTYFDVDLPALTAHARAPRRRLVPGALSPRRRRPLHGRGAVARRAHHGAALEEAPRMPTAAPTCFAPGRWPPSRSRRAGPHRWRTSSCRTASNRASASPAWCRAATSSTSACRTTTCAPARSCPTATHRSTDMLSPVERTRKNLDASISAKQQMLDDPAALEGFARAVEAVTERYRAGGRLYIAGNGGSAADAQHLAAEFVSRLARDRAPLPAEALTTDSSILTAIGNDYGFENVFSRQLAGKARAGDVFLAITTSGRSANIVKALEQCREMRLPSIVFTGGTGGSAPRARRPLRRRPGRDDERDPGAAHRPRPHPVRVRRGGALRRRLRQADHDPRHSRHRRRRLPRLDDGPGAARRRPSRHGARQLHVPPDQPEPRLPRPEVPRRQGRHPGREHARAAARQGRHRDPAGGARRRADVQCRSGGRADDQPRRHRRHAQAPVARAARPDADHQQRLRQRRPGPPLHRGVAAAADLDVRQGQGRGREGADGARELDRAFGSRPSSACRRACASTCWSTTSATAPCTTASSCCSRATSSATTSTCATSRASSCTASSTSSA